MFERIRSISGDAVLQLGDLITFFGYFAICLYVGGAMYRESFNDRFRLPVLPERDLPMTVGDFALLLFDSVVLGGLTALAVVGMSILFFLARFLLRLWFGYLVLTTTLCLALAGCAVLGSWLGARHAARLVSINADSPLPIVKLFGENLPSVDGAGLDLGSHRLLSQDANFVYVLEPQMEGSLIRVQAIRKADISRMEVTAPTKEDVAR